MRPFAFQAMECVMLKLDHLAIIAPSLEVGADYVHDALGIDMPKGGKHPQMGTHNLLLRLGADVFLEVIAVDPEAERPRRRRWFGLDDLEAVQAAWDEGRRLRARVARTSDFASGFAPSVMDGGARGTPAPSMPDFGFRLKSFQIEHPEADQVRELYADLEIIDPPTVIKAKNFRYIAEIETPRGVALIS